MGLFANIENPNELVRENYKTSWEREQEEKERLNKEDIELDLFEFCQKYLIDLNTLADFLNNLNQKWSYGPGGSERYNRLYSAIKKRDKDIYNDRTERELKKITGNNDLKLKYIERDA